MTSLPIVSADAVQQAVDQAAQFNLYAVPDPDGPDVSIRGRGGEAIGISAEHVLHRFQVICRQPTARVPITGRNIVGEAVARITQRWMVLADGDTAAMDRDPQPAPIDSSRSQRFVMRDTVCTFANGDDGFRGFGTGVTIPFNAGSAPQLLAIAVGTIVEGFGRFRGREEGTYVYCGRLSPLTGFTGNFLLRLIDRDESFRTGDALHSIAARSEAERDVTYLVFRGQAVPSDPVTPRLGEDGRPTGLIVEQGLRLIELDATGKGRPRSTEAIGPLIGRITATVTFDPMAPGGTVRDPIPFTAVDEFVFDDLESGRRVGSFTANSIEGRVFRSQILGLPGIRFGGVGRILGGDGVFAGIDGLMTDNSVVMFEPHVSASIYVLRIYDPRGLFSSRVDAEPRLPRNWKDR